MLMLSRTVAATKLALLHHTLHRDRYWYVDSARIVSTSCVSKCTKNLPNQAKCSQIEKGEVCMLSANMQNSCLAEGEVADSKNKLHHPAIPPKTATWTTFCVSIFACNVSIGD